jgi:hypothetical protein
VTGGKKAPVRAILRSHPITLLSKKSIGGKSFPSFRAPADNSDHPDEFAE